MILGADRAQPHTGRMNRRAIRFKQALGVFAFIGASLLYAQTPGDPGWPRHYSNGVSSVVIYQPQVDSWNSFKALTGRCAFGLSPSRGADIVYGTFRFNAETIVDADQKLVLLRNIQAFDMRFPSAPGGALAQWAELTRQIIPADAMIVSLDRLLAFVRAGEMPRKEAHVLTEAPPIYISSQPAVLVIIDGDPVMLDVEKTNLRRVVNTNWDLIQERSTNRFYLRLNAHWVRANNVRGPYEATSDLPADLAKIPFDDRKGASPATPSAATSVMVVDRPSELIVIQGSPLLAPIAGTQLAVIANTDSDLFFHGATQSYYFLTSGRWFRSPGLKGPWQYASATLPDDFKLIPADHPRAHVLSAVPGTREANDAVLLATIPRTAEIKRSEAKAEVQYVGEPQFAPITGTSIAYANNTPSDVLRIRDRYYLCSQGVWFTANSPAGPWVATSTVPEEIYSIPESSPKYHVTYVRIYESTPSTIVVGYTPGYYGAYVAGGVVVWGTGYYYAPYVAVAGAVPVYWGAPYYTYGASAWYNPATGVYARGAAVYGPYGGYGAAAAYNPRTGTYAQGAGVWGPNGGAAAGRTYNPSTGTYSAGYKATNPYGSWGEGVVGNGNNWARGGYQSTSRGTVAAGETSAGGKGVAVEGAKGNNGYLAKSASGDVYAGANGNVYKRDNGQWYQNQNGSWNAMNKGDLSAQREQAAARDSG